MRRSNSPTGSLCIREGTEMGTASGSPEHSALQDVRALVFQNVTAP